MKAQWPTALLHMMFGSGVLAGISIGAWIFNGSNFIRYGSLVFIAFAAYQVVTSIRSWQRQAKDASFPYECDRCDEIHLSGTDIGEQHQHYAR